MFNDVLLAPLLGLPLIAYGGIVSLILVIVTLVMGIRGAPVKTHRLIGITALVLSAIHGILGIIAFI